MKKQIFFKNGHLLILFFLFSTFFACQQDQTIGTSDYAEATFKQSVRQFYGNFLTDLRKSNIESIKTDARFNALDLTPDWEAAIFHEQGNNRFLEVPVKFSGSSDAFISTSISPSKFDKHKDVRMPMRLIFSEKEGSKLDANIMVVHSANPYPDVTPKFNLFQKIENFTGREYLYGLDGTYNRGWRHEKGKIVSNLYFSKDNVRQPLQTRDLDPLCWYWVMLDDNGQIRRVIGVHYCLPNIDDMFHLNAPFRGNGSWGGAVNTNGGSTGASSTFVPVTRLCGSVVTGALRNLAIPIVYGPNNRTTWVAGSAEERFPNQLVHGQYVEFRDLQVVGTQIDVPLFTVDFLALANYLFTPETLSSLMVSSYSTARDQILEDIVTMNDPNLYAGDGYSFLTRWAMAFNNLDQTRGRCNIKFTLSQYDSSTSTRGVTQLQDANDGNCR